MDKYIIYATDSFKKLYETLDRSEQIWIEKTKKQLEENPTGKILHFDWFREKKYLNKRLYFLIDDESKRILFVAFASKKEQQKIINFIIANKDEFFSHLRKL